jgi:hypothetical protein
MCMATWTSRFTPRDDRRLSLASFRRLQLKDLLNFSQQPKPPTLVYPRLLLCDFNLFRVARCASKISDLGSSPPV